MNGLNESFCARSTSWQHSFDVIREHILALGQSLSLVPKFTIHKQEIIFWYMVFRSVKIVNTFVHVGSDRIRRVVHEFTRTHKIPLPKKIARPKVLAAEVMAVISTVTAFCPAASCTQLQRFIEARDIHISSESIRLAKHELKFSYKPRNKDGSCPRCRQCGDSLLPFNTVNRKFF
jgi:transposase